MADLSDCENAFVQTITNIIYPNGTSQPSAIIVGSTAYACRIYAGWPEPDQIDADMVATSGVPPVYAPVVNISIYAMPGMEHNTTRFPREWFDQFKGVATITATLNAVSILIGGTITVGQYVSVLIGRSTAYSYAAQAGDTLATFAAALAALIPSATVSGDLITLPLTTEGLITVRVGAPGTIIQELERTNQMFMVSIWTPNNAIRTVASTLIRPALAAIDYFKFPDATVGRLLYDQAHNVSVMQKENVFRRDIRYWVEYATCLTQPGYPITIFQNRITTPSAQVINSPIGVYDITQPTIFVSGPGIVMRVSVNVAGTTDGGIYDCATLDAANVSNQVSVINKIVDYEYVDWEFQTGICIIPGTGQILSVQFTALPNPYIFNS